MRVFVSFLSVEFTILLGRLFMFLPLCLAVLSSGVTLDKACPYMTYYAWLYEASGWVPPLSAVDNSRMLFWRSKRG